MSDKIGLFTGSFDPMTNGHLDMIERASIEIQDTTTLKIGTYHVKDSSSHLIRCRPRRLAF